MLFRSRNLLSGTQSVEGKDCVLLKISTNNPAGASGTYDLLFTGSQHSFGSNYTTGVYETKIFLSSNDDVIKAKLLESSSIRWNTAWLSLDTSLTYSAGETLTFFNQSRKSVQDIKKLLISTEDIQNSYSFGEEIQIRVNMFDQASPYIKTTKLPLESVNVVLKNVGYSVRDAVSGDVVVPHDESKNSTKLSSDSKGMFFKLCTAALFVDRTYVIDIHLNMNGIKHTYKNVSPIFKITK